MPEPASPCHPKTLRVRVRSGATREPRSQAPSGGRPIDFSPFGPLQPVLAGRHPPAMSRATLQRTHFGEVTAHLRKPRDARQTRRQLRRPHCRSGVALRALPWIVCVASAHQLAQEYLVRGRAWCHHKCRCGPPTHLHLVHGNPRWDGTAEHGVRNVPAGRLPCPVPTGTTVACRAAMLSGSMPCRGSCPCGKTPGSQHSVPSLMSRTRQSGGQEVATPPALTTICPRSLAIVVW